MRAMIPAIAAVLFAAPLAAKDSPDLEMWRLDCGKIEMPDASSFSDAHLYDGESREFVVGCYLVRNGGRYLLWDAGLSSDLAGKTVVLEGGTLSMERSIVDQLGDLGLRPDQINFVGVSHYHFDHAAQLTEFPGSTLVIGAGDWAAVTSTSEPNALMDPRHFAPWLGEDAGNVTVVPHDHDVFGDGSVLFKAMPGHTPGHASLLVRLPDMGDVLLTGDLYHFEEQIANRGVPSFNTSRADTLASFERFNAMAKSLDATVIIQHDPRHLDRLPAFPESEK
ncbi:N-acyl homoserine lactonase family protein [Altererythrobacter litoralis]|uniref:N-acyl homoserine lactonase family protein n=1 Tax=Altererythrobacter litoralis TaxID=3113904 RepID=A0ABU7GDG8_9SPHN|nr:N-acyl homoserine lactonase family protein [Erythrobacteraceae bacterium 1XM1-14]